MDQEFTTPLSSPNDPWAYRYLKLQNKMKILLIHNPQAMNSSCSISVGVGSYSDPDRSLGLAHLLEHMIFMGSKNYPSENQYEAFMSMNSGMQNAETTDRSTNFYFSVAPNAFEEAIARTCDALTNALLSPTSLNKERQAIHQQYILSSNDDDTRMEELLKLFAPPSHPYHRFNIGNNQSLSHEYIEADMKQFYDKYYSADIMCAVLYCADTLDRMQAKFLKYFEQITNKETSKKDYFQQYDARIFTLKKEQHIPLVITQTINNCETLKIHWFVQNLQTDGKYLHHIVNYLEYILTNPSSNSLQSILEQKQLSSSLSLSFQNLTTAQSLLTMEIEIAQQDKQITPENCNKIIRKIFAVVIQYLRSLLTTLSTLSTLSTEGREIYNELRYWKEVDFKNRQISDLEDYLCEMAEKVREGVVDEKNVIADCGLFADYNEKIITDCIKEMVESGNVIVIYGQPDNFAKSKVQPNFSSLYRIEELPYPAPIDKKPLKLSPNPFLPLTQELHSNSQSLSPIRSSTMIFYNPIGNKILKGGIQLFLYNNETSVFNKLFVEFMDLYSQEIQNLSYAEMIGLDIYYDYIDGRLFLYIYGFDEIVVKIINDFGERVKEMLDVEKMKDDENMGDMFKQAMENVFEDIDNYYEEEMDDLADKIRDQLLLQAESPLSMMSKELDKIKRNKFFERAAALWRHSVFQWVIVGNFNREKIEQVCSKFQANVGNQSRKMSQKPIKMRQQKVLALNNGKIYRHQVRLQSPGITTSTCLVYLQAGLYTNKLYYQLQMLYNYLDGPFFKELRTEKKLAYDLEIKLVNTRGILGLCFMLVSSTVDPQIISMHIHQFIEKYMSGEKMRKNLENGVCEKLKQSVAIRCSEQFVSLVDLFDFIIEETENRTFFYTRRKTKNIVEFSEQELIGLADSMKKAGSMEIHIISQSHKAEYSRHRPKTTSLDQIKSKASYHEDVLADLSFSFCQGSGSDS